MCESYRALAEVAQIRLQDEGADSQRRVAVDRVLDSAWAATESWSRGFLRLPSAPQTEPYIASARLLADTLFPDGLKFTQLRFRVQWFESQNRLELIEKLGLEQQFEALGGRIYLDVLRQAHKEYGDVLGITSADEPVDLPSLRDALDRFRSDLRRYVVRVIAHVEPGQPATRELADHLLAPLTRWKGAPASPSREPADQPGSEPGSEPAEPAGAAMSGEGAGASTAAGTEAFGDSAG